MWLLLYINVLVNTWVVVIYGTTNARDLEEEKELTA